jgi:hypothetical protein
MPFSPVRKWSPAGLGSPLYAIFVVRTVGTVALTGVICMFTSLGVLPCCLPNGSPTERFLVTGFGAVQRIEAVRAHFPCKTWIARLHSIAQQMLIQEKESDEQPMRDPGAP